MTRSRLLLLCLAFSACHCEPSPEPERPGLVAVPKIDKEGSFHQMSFAERLHLRKPQKPDGGVDLAAGLDHFAEFSSNGRVFAYTLDGQLHFRPVPTGAEATPLPLDTPAHREEALEALENAGVPPNGDRSPPPIKLSAAIQNGSVLLALPGAPPFGSYKPFAGSSATVDKAEVVGETHNRKYAAVRITGTLPGGKGPVAEYHLFPLSD